MSGASGMRARAGASFVPLLSLLMAAAVPAHAAARAAATPDAAVRAAVDAELPSLRELYVALHAAPELSRMEVQTSARLATELRALGYEVTERVGRYPERTEPAYGVVAVLRNGAGPTLLIRADMDALPVEEKTGLAYASRVRTRLASGAEVPVMHACGHDIHVTALIGVARVLKALRANWRGTLVLVGQPSEETLDGAQALLRDGLYERFPRPDRVIALHDSGDLPAGRIGVTPGYAMATSTQVDVLVRGVGGHGSKPEQAKDPIVLAANIVMQLQTIVSREISPFDQAVLTVGTIHGGLKRNIIPDEVKLEINLRAYDESVRLHLVEAIARIARAAALGAGMPEDRLPVVKVLEGEFAPALRNDAALTARLRASFVRTLGAANVVDTAPIMASEDFGQYALEGRIPVSLVWVGAVNADAYAKAEAAGTTLPSIHSPQFAPDPLPTLRTAIVAMSGAALDLLAR